jgi:hypothetical protein
MELLRVWIWSMDKSHEIDNEILSLLYNILTFYLLFKLLYVLQDNKLYLLLKYSIIWLFTSFPIDDVL